MSTLKIYNQHFINFLRNQWFCTFKCIICDDLWC